MSKKKAPPKPVCAVTGEPSDDMKSVRFYNNEGGMIGYVFISPGVIENSKDYRIEVKVDWEYIDRERGAKVRIITPPKIIKA